MNDADVPETLFRFRNLEAPFGRKAAEDIILHNRMYWQNPLQFNDPMDCNPVYFFGKNEKEREEFRRRGVSTHFSEMSRVERRTALRNFRKKPKEHFEELARNGFRDAMEASAVCCFSALNNNMLMWSHYANSHRGLCFRFQGPVQADWIPFPVSYSRERPRVNLTRLREVEALQESVLLKSEDWEYEKEYRMIDYRGGAGYRAIPDGYFDAVILGAKIDPEDEEFVRGLCHKRPNIEVLRASLNDSEFSIDIGPAD